MKMCFTINGFKIKGYLTIDNFTHSVRCCISVFLLPHTFLSEGLFSWFFLLPGGLFELFFITTPSLSCPVGRFL